jgi:dTDP-4-dehydrorhamnose reductase
MKILITGASGYLGSSLEALFSQNHQVVGTQLTSKNEKFIHLDLTQEDDAVATVSKLQPDVIIHTANLIDECATDPMRARSVNIKGTENLLKASEKIGSKFIFISSGAVFDGGKGVFSEKDSVVPSSEYGRMKAETEELVRKLSSCYLIVRPSLIIGSSSGGKNKFYNRTIRSLFNKEKGLTLDHDWKFNPTWTKHIGEVIGWWIDQSTHESEILHVAVPEVVSKQELMQLIANKLGLEVSIKPRSYEKPKSSSKERWIPTKEIENTARNNILDVGKLKRLNIQRYTLDEVVNELVNELE